jgi:hypothetical protein
MLLKFVYSGQRVLAFLIVRWVLSPIDDEITRFVADPLAFRSVENVAFRGKLASVATLVILGSILSFYKRRSKGKGAIACQDHSEADTG